jgi:hypothetical protein
MTRNRLYLLLFLALLAGYSYVLYISRMNVHNHLFTPCIFKNVTGIACPSCGITRSVLSLANGSATAAFQVNPLGLIVAAIMAIAPFWLLYDTVLKKETLYKSYKKTEILIRTKKVAIPLITLIIINWGWNIYKGL